MVEDDTRPFLKEWTMKNKLLRTEKHKISHYHSLNHEDCQGQKECTEGIFAVAIKPENFKEKAANIFSVDKLKVDPQVAMATKSIYSSSVF